MTNNYRKSFNLRNGVQVDNDNFIVNSNGLVGIGTSIPKNYLLSVYGDANITGLITASNIISNNLTSLGVSTVRFLTATDVQVSGAVTATTFYGSASGLTGIYAIAVGGWHVSGGNISTTSNVGIGTTLPNGNFQVGIGATINSNGNATYLGIVTAYSFSGFGTDITNINASNISSGTLSNSRLPSNVIAYSFSGFGTDITNIDASNISSGTLSNSRLPSNINVVGVITASNFYGIASTAQSITGSPNIVVTNITATNSNVTGISTISTIMHVGSGGTAFAALESGRIGVGTALPTSEVQIRKLSGTLVEVISDSGQSRISIGNSVGVGRSTAVLRFGSQSKTFDIINNDTGNINSYLHAGPAGVGTGRFAWLYGQSNAELASLTYDGKLGLGITNPTSNLHVVGTSTVTGNANFGSNVTISGNLTAGTITLPSLIANTNIINSSGVSTFFDLNVNQNLTAANIGIGTTLPISDFDARGQIALIGSLGINTSTAKSVLDVSGVALFESIGIGTTNPANIEYEGISIIDRTVGVHDTAIVIKNTSLVLDDYTLIGIGTTVARSVIDFSDAGRGYPQQAFMLPPRLTDVQRAGLSTVAGAFIFNLSVGKFQGYTGVAWTDFH